MRTPLRSARRLLVPVALGVLVLAGCGGSDDDSSSGEEDTSSFDEAVSLMDEAKPKLTEGDQVEVKAVDNSFKPEYIEVKAGTTVTFTNDGRNVHNVIPVEDDAFTAIQADAFAAGDTGTVTFDKAGDFPFYCSLHGTATKGMIGGVRVVP